MTAYHNLQTLISEYQHEYIGKVVTTDMLRDLWYTKFNSKPPSFSLYTREHCKKPALLQSVGHSRFMFLVPERPVKTHYEMVRDCMREYVGRRMSIAVLTSTLELELQMKEGCTLEKVHTILRELPRFCAGDKRIPQNVVSPIFDRVGKEYTIIYREPVLQPGARRSSLPIIPTVQVTIECDLDRLAELQTLLADWIVCINQ